MADLKRLYFGTQTKTRVQSNTINHTHSFGFETETDQNGFFNVNYNSNPPGFQQSETRTVGIHTFTPRTGTYSAGSIEPPHGTVSEMETTFTIPVGAENAVFEVWCFVHHEINDEVSTNGWYAIFDYFRVRKNGSVVYQFYWGDQDDTRTELANWNPYNPPYVDKGSTTWNSGHGCPWGKWFNLKFSLTPGTYTFSFAIVRDDGDHDPANIYGTRAHYIEDLKVTYTTRAGEIIIVPGQPLIHFDGSEGYHLLRSVEGAILPPLQHAEYSLPFQPGSVHEYTSVEARDFDMELWIQCLPGESIRDKLRRLASVLANREGALFAEMSDGTVRELPCRLSELEQQENSDTQGIGRFFKTLLTFRVFDPFWYGPLEEFTTHARYDGEYLSNEGDFETWPIYRIYGPITSPEILLKHPDNPADADYIKKMKLNYKIPADRIVTIDSRPGYKTITLDDGTNLYRYLDGALNQMFSIPPGQWWVDLDGSNYDSDFTKVVIHWREAYWGM